MATSMVRSRHGDPKASVLFFGWRAKTFRRARIVRRLILGFGRPFAALLEEFEADRRPAGKGAPIDDSSAGPEVATNRLEHQEAARLPKPLGGYSGATRTDILRRGGFGAPGPAQVGEFHWFGRDGPGVSADTSVGFSECFAGLGHSGSSPFSHYLSEDSYNNTVFTRVCGDPRICDQKGKPDGESGSSRYGLDRASAYV